jgi:hypothetical protein
LRLAGLIGAAVVSAFLLNKWMGPQRRKQAATLFDGLNVLIMVVFAIALMAGIPDRVIAQPLYASRTRRACNQPARRCSTSSPLGCFWLPGASAP